MNRKRVCACVYACVPVFVFMLGGGASRLHYNCKILPNTANYKHDSACRYFLLLNKISTSAQKFSDKILGSL